MFQDLNPKALPEQLSRQRFNFSRIYFTCLSCQPGHPDSGARDFSNGNAQFRHLHLVLVEVCGNIPTPMVAKWFLGCRTNIVPRVQALIVPQELGQLRLSALFSVCVRVPAATVSGLRGSSMTGCPMRMAPDCCC